MTTVEHAAFASPLDLLAQWRSDLPDGPPLRELLILGYTVDLAFLERFCVPAARQLGARVTVLGDSARSVHDAVDVRFAGRAYQHGLAALGGAFHPKLAVLAGDEHLWMAIGSGNPTMSGWGHNNELWWVLRGRTDRGPQAQADLGVWLADLATRVSMPSWIAATIGQIGRRIVPQEVDGTHADVRVLHNLDRPLIDQLPTGSVDDLRLAAPFFDPSGQAVRAVVDRFRPRSLTVGLQENLGSYEGRTLVDAAARVERVEFRSLDEGRTMHAKLVEWVAQDGRRTVLVGSANITTPALLRTIAGGNCELAVLSPVVDSLFPPSESLTQADVAARATWDLEDRDDAPSLHLLGCRRHDDDLAIEFVARHAVAVTVETSVDGSPGSWDPKATVPASHIDVGRTTSAQFTVPEVTGGVVRLVAMINGTRTESAPVFVTDTTRCRPRTDVGDSPQLLRDYVTEQVFTDAALAARFDRDLRRLLDLSSQHRASAVPAPARTDGQEVTTRSDDDRWQRFLDVVAHTLGASMAELVFPGALPSAAPAESAGWSVAEIGDETELAEDETEEAIENIEEPARVRRAIVIPPGERARYRAWARRWVAAVTRQPRHRDGTVPLQPALPLRMTVGALFLELLAAGVWRSDESWRDDLADLVQALVADSDEVDATPPEGHGYLGSLVAVCLTVLLHDAELHGGTPADITARRAWEAGHAYAAEAEEALIEAMLLTSTQTDSRLAVMSEVEKLVMLAREAVADPFAEAKAGFGSDGVEVYRQSGAWVLRGSFRNTMRVAARGATEFAVAEGVVVVATDGARSTVMLRRGTVLIMADSTVRRWRTMSVRPPTTPASLFAGGEGLPTSQSVVPLAPLPPAVRDLAAAAGADVVELVRTFLSSPHGRRRDTTWDW